MSLFPSYFYTVNQNNLYKATEVKTWTFGRGEFLPHVFFALSYMQTSYVALFKIHRDAVVFCSIWQVWQKFQVMVKLAGICRDAQLL